MNRYIFFILINLLFVIGGCSSYDEKTIEHVLEKEGFTNVEEIIITNGSTGEIKTITDEIQIEELLSLINDVTLYKDANQEARDGFLYNLLFKEGSKKLSISNKMVHDTYYTTDPNLANILKPFYEQITFE
jgi:hypothetical protein